jgi:nitrate reductase NapE component
VYLLTHAHTQICVCVVAYWHSPSASRRCLPLYFARVSHTERHANSKNKIKEDVLAGTTRKTTQTEKMKTKRTEKCSCSTYSNCFLFLVLLLFPTLSTDLPPRYTSFLSILLFNALRVLTPPLFGATVRCAGKNAHGQKKNKNRRDTTGLKNLNERPKQRKGSVIERKRPEKKNVTAKKKDNEINR